jgi:hypothetical protein
MQRMSCFSVLAIALVTADSLAQAEASAQASSVQNAPSQAANALRLRWQPGETFTLDIHDEFRIDYPSITYTMSEFNRLACTVESIDDAGNATIHAVYDDIHGLIYHGNDLKARFGNVNEAYIFRGWDQHDTCFRTLHGQSFAFSVTPDGVINTVTGIEKIHSAVMAAFRGQSTPIDGMISPGARFTEGAYKNLLGQCFRIPVPADAADDQTFDPPADWIGKNEKLTVDAKLLAVQAGDENQRLIRGIVEFARPDQHELAKDRYLGGGIDDALLWDTATGRPVSRVIINSSRTARTSPPGDPKPPRNVDYTKSIRVEFDFSPRSASKTADLK